LRAVELHPRKSSFRCRAPEATLELARELAAVAGIAEVTDLTDRDVLGLPVFISHRPAANSFAYGKGLEPIDAELGAYMESIEYHFSEPHSAHRVVTRWGTAREVVGVAEAPSSFLDFCPRLGRAVELDGPLLLAEAEALDGARAWVPAELAFSPVPEVGQALFGASSNGLASGNSVLEASVHALTELLERDIWSFEFVRRSSQRVADDSLPDEIAAVSERARRHGLELVVRTILNEHELPFFAAFLFDPSQPRLRSFNGGWGCHIDARVALTRAVTEAAQSRLAYIHGGRSEPRRPTSLFAAGERDEQEQIEAQIAVVRSRRGSVRWGELERAAVPTPDGLERMLEHLLARVSRATGRTVYRLCYTDVDSPLAVVRLIAPGLEHFCEGRTRIGPRLARAIETSARAARAEERASS
jgi:ribosomal protein S12 methylthiotransferase accessory factor